MPLPYILFVCDKLARMARNEHTTLAQICEVIQHDAEFCDYVLLLANQFPRVYEPVRSLRHALMLLGMERICQLAENHSLWRGVKKLDLGPN